MTSLIYNAVLISAVQQSDHIYICYVYTPATYIGTFSLSGCLLVCLADLVFAAARGLSLVAERGGCSPAAARRLLTAAAPLTVAHRLSGVQASLAAASGLTRCCSWAPALRLSSCVTWA